VTLSRSFSLGPAVREEHGEAKGQALSAAVTLSRQFSSANFLVEPLLTLSWRKLHLDGWIEADGQSTSISVEDLDEETLEAGIGIRAEPIGRARWAPFGSAALYRTVAGNPATVTITPAGAPVPFTAPEFDRSSHRAEIEAGIKGPIGANGKLVAGGRWSPIGDSKSTELRLTFAHAF
jgi:outer membrane lipase/esterase